MTAEDEWKPTPRIIVDVTRREHSTLLRLECGHDRSIGGNVIRDEWASGAAHLMAGAHYPCFDGHCGKFERKATDHAR